MLRPALPVEARAHRGRRVRTRRAILRARDARRRPQLDVTNVRILYKE